MNREEFELLVVKAVDSLPEELRSSLDNVAVLVDDWPIQHQLAKARLGRGQTLDSMKVPLLQSVVWDMVWYNRTG